MARLRLVRMITQGVVLAAGSAVLRRMHGATGKVVEFGWRYHTALGQCSLLYSGAACACCFGLVLVAVLCMHAAQAGSVVCPV